jgi:hypothetical protein
MERRDEIDVHVPQIPHFTPNVVPSPQVLITSDQHGSARTARVACAPLKHAEDAMLDWSRSKTPGIDAHACHQQCCKRKSTSSSTACRTRCSQKRP